MADPIWQRSSALHLFHHTTPEAAEHITTTGVFHVGPANLLGPTGVHAVSDDPETVSLEWVSTEYFFRLWPIEALGGVVVFLGDDEQQPFEPLTPNIWVLPASIGPLDVADVAVGWGYRQPYQSWWWSTGLLT